MLVSNNSLLNILLPAQNKNLENALKEADVKTFNDIKKGSTSASEILKNLFSDVKTGDKSNINIENLLKNSNIFKDLGSFSKAATTLLNQMENNPALAKYKPLLQGFLQNITTLDENTLKEQILKSGIFLESKVSNQLNMQTSLPKNLENILNEIKNILKNIPTNEAKNITSFIDKILQNNNTNANISQTLQMQNNSDLKSLVSMLQNLSKGLSDNQLSNLTHLTNTLKNISSDAQLIESKVQNFNTAQSSILNQQEPVNQNQMQNLFQSKESVLNKTIDTLQQLKSELLVNKTIPEAQNIIKQIDSLLLSNDLFSKNASNVEAKNLINQLINLPDIKNSTNINTNLANLVESLKGQVEQINQLENKALQNLNIQTDKAVLTQNINQTLFSLKNELSNMTNIDSKGINQIIDKLLNLENIFSKIDLPNDAKTFLQNIQNQTLNQTNFQSNFSSNINELILNLKENITNLSSNNQNLHLQNNIIKTVEKLESIINHFLQLDVAHINKNQNTNHLQNDMKTILMQMQTELLTKDDTNSQETLRQVERMITQIEYHQLLSIVSNSHNVYVPFIWDMLDEGTIGMKKVDNDKFYCEINLSLKEFGETQLLLALYDKNKIDLTIYASKESFKKSLRENSSKLKQALNSVDLIPVNFKIIDLKEEKEKQNMQTQKIDVYGQDNNLGFGVNIKA